MVKLKNILVVLFLLSASFIWADSLTVSVGERASYVAPTTVTRIVNTKRTVCAVQKTVASLEITAIKPGESLVYYWDLNNIQHVLKVVVVGRAYTYASTSATSKGKYELFVKNDPKNETPVNKRMVVNRLSYAAQSNGYGVDFFAEYKNVGLTDKSNIEQLDSFHLVINKDNNYLLLGDDTVQYTALTAQYLAFQGARTGFNLWNTRWDIFSGRRAGQYWGDVIKYNSVQAPEEKTNLAGGRVVLDLQPLQLGLTRLTRSGAENQLSTLYRDTTVTAYDARYRYGQYTLSAESGITAADDNLSKAGSAGLDYEGDTVGYRLSVMDIAPKYTSVSDYMLYQGAKGYTFWGRFNPLRALGFSTQIARYEQRYDQNYYSVLNDNYMVDRRSVRLGFSGLPFMHMSVNTFRNLGYKSEMTGQTLLFDQIPIWREYLVYSYEIAPWKFTYDGQDTQMFSYRSGLSSQVNSWCALRLENQNELRLYSEGQENTNPHGITGVAQLGDFIVPWTSSVKFNVGYWYQHRENAQGTLDNTRTAWRLRVQQLIGKDFFWYLNAVTAHERSQLFEFEKVVGYVMKDVIVQSEVSGGLSYAF